MYHPPISMVVITGVSGSGKVTGIRYYLRRRTAALHGVLSLMPVSFLGRMEKTGCGYIEGLSPAISSTKSVGKNRVHDGTITNYDYLRLLFAR